MRRPSLDNIPVSGQKPPSSFMLWEAFPSSLASPRGIKLLMKNWYMLWFTGVLPTAVLPICWEDRLLDSAPWLHSCKAILCSLLYLPSTLVMFMDESPLGPFSSGKKFRLPKIHQKIIGRRFQGGSWNKVRNTKRIHNASVMRSLSTLLIKYFSAVHFCGHHLWFSYCWMLKVSQLCICLLYRIIGY